MKKFKHNILAMTLAVMLSLTAVMFMPTITYAINDYPQKWQEANQDTIWDIWGHTNRSCTGWVWWCLSTRNGFELAGVDLASSGKTWNAINWANSARERGFTVDNTPAVGSVAQWDLSKTVGSGWGHVAWVTEVNNSAAPKFLLGKAIGYALGQRLWLERVLLDGRLEISNNRAERSIKPFVIGRKNWLFSNTTKGAQASSIFYSIIETAKENDLNPYAYLTHVFKTMPNLTDGSLDDLLPGSECIPDHCRCPRPKQSHYVWEED